MSQGSYARGLIILKRLAVGGVLLLLCLKLLGEWRSSRAFNDPVFYSGLQEFGSSAGPVSNFEIGAWYLLHGQTMRAISVLKQLPDTQSYVAGLETDLKQRIAAAPKRWQLKIMLALAYVNHEQFKLAASTAEATLQNYPHIGWNHLILAYCAAKDNRLDDALVLGRLAVQDLPQLPLANVLLALGFWQHQNHGLALKQLGLTFFSFHLSELWWVLNAAMDGLVVSLPSWAALLLLLTYFILLRRLCGINESLWRSLRKLW